MTIELMSTWKRKRNNEKVERKNMARPRRGSRQLQGLQRMHIRRLRLRDGVEAAGETITEKDDEGERSPKR